MRKALLKQIQNDIYKWFVFCLIVSTLISILSAVSVYLTTSTFSWRTALGGVLAFAFLFPILSAYSLVKYLLPKQDDNGQ
jgi:hypothetical protein